MSKLYRSRKLVQAVQYTGQSHPDVLIGKNDPYDRWDETPDGPYVLVNAGNGFRKTAIVIGDWIIKSIQAGGVEGVMSDVLFKLCYEPLEKIKKPTPPPTQIIQEGRDPKIQHT